jgi:hypothetical protein
MKTATILFMFLGVASSALAQAGTATSAGDVAALKADIERMRGLLPDQAHAMKDVGYHFSNLWFAGQAQNWPLAEFYLGETRSHLQWAVRIIPVRKTPEGQELRLADLLDVFEKTSLKQLHDAVAAKDGESFRNSYRQMLASCYSCHVAAGKPYLRLKVPEHPDTSIIEFDPKP